MSGYQTTKCYDAIYVIGQDWRFMDSEPCNFYIKRPIKVRQCRQNKIERFRSIHPKRNAVEIHLGLLGWAELSIIITKGETSLEHQHELEECLLTSMETALGPKSKTRYHSKAFKEKSTLVIVGCEKMYFFRKLFRVLNQKLQQRGMEAWAMASSIGQSMPFDEGWRTLENLDLDYIHEVFVHYTIDIQKPGKILIWRRQLQNDFPGQLKEQYYPSLVSNGGNFNFILTEYETYSNQIQDETIEVTELKLYNKVNSDIHDFVSPFRAPYFGLMAISKVVHAKDRDMKTKGIKRSELNQASEWLKIARNILENSWQAAQVARAEIGISVESPAEGFSERIMDEGDVFAETHFPDWPEVIKEFDINLFREHVKEQIGPAVQTLSMALESLKDENSYMGCERIRAIFAAESIICYFIFGIATSTRVRAGHVKEICHDLGLTKRDSKRSKTITSPSLRNLYENPIIRVSQDGGLIYNPVCNVMAITLIREGLRQNGAFETDLATVLCQLRQFPKEQMKEAFALAVRYILKIAIKCNLSVRKKRSRDFESFTETFCHADNYEIFSSHQIVGWLRKKAVEENQLHGYSPLVFAHEVIRAFLMNNFQMGSNFAAAFSQTFIKTFQDICNETTSFLTLYSDQDNVSIHIIPFVCDKNFDQVHSISKVWARVFLNINRELGEVRQPKHIIGTLKRFQGLGLSDCFRLNYKQVFLYMKDCYTRKFSPHVENRDKYGEDTVRILKIPSLV